MVLWNVISAVSELLGALAVVGSLIYVAIQIRQNTTAIRTNTIQAIADQANDMNIAIATDEQLPRLLAEMFENDVRREDLSPEDRWRLTIAVMAGLRRVENVFLQARAGVVDQGAFARIGFGFYRTRFSRATWSMLRANFDPGFARYLDGILAQDAAEQEVGPG